MFRAYAATLSGDVPGFPPGDVRRLRRDVKSRRSPNMVPSFFYEVVETIGLLTPVLPWRVSDLGMTKKTAAPSAPPFLESFKPFA